MAVTARLGLTLLEVGQLSKESIIANNMTLIDAGVAVLAATNTFAALQTFNAGINVTSIVASGAIKGNNTALTVGRLQYTFPGDADQTLSASDYSNPLIEIQTGIITVTRNLIFPGTVGGLWYVRNLNTQAVVCKTLAGTGPTIAAARGAWIYSGGANIIRATADSLST
jgi:hypothetical protein